MLSTCLSNTPCCENALYVSLYCHASKLKVEMPTLNATLSKKNVKANKESQDNQGKQANQETHKKTFGFYSREGV